MSDEIKKVENTDKTQATNEKKFSLRLFGHDITVKELIAIGGVIAVAIGVKRLRKPDKSFDINKFLELGEETNETDTDIDD